MEFTAQPVVVDAQPVYPSRTTGRTAPLDVIRSYGAPYMGLGVACAWFFALLFLIITLRSVFGGRSPVYDNCADTRAWADSVVPSAANAYDTLLNDIQNISAQLLFFSGQGFVAAQGTSAVKLATLTTTVAPTVAAGDGSVKCNFDAVADVAWLFAVSVPSSATLWHASALMMLNVSYVAVGTNATQLFQLIFPPHASSNPNALFSSGCRVLNISGSSGLSVVDEAYSCDYPLSLSTDTFVTPTSDSQDISVMVRPLQGAFEACQSMFKGSGVVYSGDGSGSSGSYSGTSIFVGFVATLACIIGACALSSMYMRHRRAAPNPDQYSTIRQEADLEMSPQYY